MPAPTNLLVEALSPELRKQILGAARTIDLPQGTVLYTSGEPCHYAYFLTAGVASVVVSVSDGSSAEVGMIGAEGVAGAHALLGPRPPLAQCFMQVSGSGLRVTIAELRRLFLESEELRARILEALQLQMLMLDQIAGCNKLHQASERLARWLLTAADRVNSDTVSLTQEAISQMLGTRRTTVALVAGTLQRAGMIGYRRGLVKILDRQALTDAACDCYGITRKLIDNLYNQPFGQV
ncbi:Crp/Fnr family transcriptional regulator [Terriglobus roseus]|uniref:cAMP-binding domain of CRP or a regulatory subunit of cAMP-dependent protein kinases n=1 Tax=Terriglobus roseus TaxID=392734 RepID=A0A1H4LPU5_9BACT|nr:Crp/Fnr family transcriptional regulator [Terriglobus roseus]SEB72750.1 cAMP-binding domain of CRP or a regulatory subunit of cAMP-dependent protein kinases [Terriglobus roseus]